MGRVTAAIALLLGLLLTACGGGGDDGDVATGPGERFAEVADDTTTTARAADDALRGSSGGTVTTAPPAATVIRPASVTASATAPPGEDAAGNTITYDAANLVDGNPSTAWRVSGNGQGVVITVRFAQPVRVTSLGFVNGYVKVDPSDGADRFPQNRRVARVNVLFGSGSQELRLADTRELQRFPITRDPTTEINIEILESTASTSRDYTALSEIEVQGTPAA
jgi:hypothetical protein